MTEFRTLPIRRGDAFLLRSSRGDYLFDGGFDGCELPELLADRKVRKLRTAICTTLARERTGGILDLMEKGFPIGEIWLPSELETLLEMARRFDGNWESWISLTHGKTDEFSLPSSWTDQADDARNVEVRRLEGVAILLGLGVSACLGRSPYGGVSRSVFRATDGGSSSKSLARFFSSTLELLGDRAAARWASQRTPMGLILRNMGSSLINGGTTEDIAMLCGRLLLLEADLLPGGDKRGLRPLVEAIAMTAMTGALVARTSIRVLFIHNTGNHEARLIPHHPIKCINGLPSKGLHRISSTYTPEKILRLIKKIAADGDGLVFQYGDRHCGALFCSNSRFPFIKPGDALFLDRPTVVAAPRQGSPAADRAYLRISPSSLDGDVWIRSHFSNARQISDHFKAKPRKYCLANCSHHTIEEILLTFRDREWNAVSGSARCTCT